MGNKIDIEAIKQQFDIERVASKRAVLNPPLPRSTDTELDEPQRELVNFFGEKLGTAKQQAQGTIKKNLGRLEELEIEIEDARCDTLAEEAQTKINQIFSTYKQRLVNAYAAHTYNHRLFQHFRLMHSLKERDASYPDSSIFHWSIIFALVIAESIANSYFFAQGSNFGLIGGLLQAILVAIVNVGVALVIGRFVLPRKNIQDQYGEKTNKELSYGLIFLLCALLVLFNLAVAHYREAISADPISAIIQAIPKLLESPFGIKHLDAWMLFGLGNLSAFIAMLKSYTSDDIYPGYGAADRKDKALFQEYNDLKEQLKEELLVVIHEHEDKAKASKLYFRRHVNAYRNAITSCEKDHQRFLDELRDVEKACNQVLTHYRETNIQTRGAASPPPDYFKQEYQFDDEFTELEPLELAAQKTNLQKYDQDSSNINTIVQDAMKALRELSDDVLNEQFSQQIRLIEAEGSHQITKAKGNAANTP